MNTLRSILFGCDEDSGESWGYVGESGAEICLGNKHYAERICAARDVECVKLNSIQESIDPTKSTPRETKCRIGGKKGGAHHSEKSDYKRSKEKEKVRKQINDE